MSDIDGKLLQRAFAATFRGGGWAEPAAWEDFDEDQQAYWSAAAKWLAEAIAALPREGDGWRPAFDAWVAAERARIEAVNAYNERLAVVNAARRDGDWSGRLDLEWKAMQRAQAAARAAEVTLSRAALPGLWPTPPHQDGGGE